MLEIRNIHKTFNEGTINEKKVFEGLSLTLEEGDFVTVIGGNGAGKSTMLNVVAGAYSVDEGEVIIDGVDVTRLPEYKRAKYIGRVFQDPRMGTASDMWVEENMSVADSRGHRRGVRWAIRGKDREKYREQLKQLDLGLEAGDELVDLVIGQVDADELLDDGGGVAVELGHQLLVAQQLLDDLLDFCLDIHGFSLLFVIESV